MRKKLFAMLLAITLVLSFCSIAAFAEGDPDPPPYDPKTVNIFRLPIRYKINQATSVNPETKFYFECFEKSFYTDPDDESPLSDLDMTFPEIAVPSITFAAQTATLEGITQDAEFTIQPIPKVGIYEYRYEVISDHQAVRPTYDVFALRLSVYNGPEPNSKQMVVDVLAMNDEPTSVDPETGSSVWEMFKVDELEVEYRAYEYSITKEVAGNLGDRDKEFEFTVNLEGAWYQQVYPDWPDHNEEEGYPHVTISYGGAVSGSFDLADVVTTTKEIRYEGTEFEYLSYAHLFEKEITFSLKHGQTVTFTNVPEMVTITTTETDYSGVGYVTTIDGVETATATYTVYAPEPVMNDDPDEPAPVTDPDTGEIVYQYGNGSVTVVNTKNGAIDTGVLLDNLPYIIAVVFVVACGITFFIIRKRRGSDDSYEDET